MLSSWWLHTQSALAPLALALHLGALLVLAVYGVHRLWLVLGALRAPGPAPDAPRAAGAPDAPRAAGAPDAADAAGAPRAQAPRAPGELPVITVQLPLYNEPAVAALRARLAP